MIRYDQKEVMDMLSVPIEDILSHLGYSNRHQGQMYYSPFRSESSPSFHINRRCNVWYDHGAGVGGGVLDLVRILLGCTVCDAMNFLADIRGVIPVSVPDYEKTIEEEKTPMIRIVDALSPIVNRTLIEYAISRGISNELLERYCKEVVYEVRGKNNRRYHAIGFPNCEGGYVLRSPRYKRCTINAPTWIDADGTFSSSRSSGTLCLFEGFIDFLSWKMIGEPGRYDCCVLNSVNNLGKILTRAMQYDTVMTFLDNDEAGLKAFSQLAQALEATDVSISEMSGLYEGYKDLNEMLVSTAQHLNT